MGKTGTTLTLHEVLFSWALAEAYSPRWRDTMREGLSKPLLDRLATGEIRFPVSEETELVERLKTHRKDKLQGYIFPFSQFMLLDTQMAQLATIAVSPQVSGWEKTVTLAQFIDGKYSQDTAHDPRNEAKRMLHAPEPIAYAGYPIVSYSKRLACPVLIEGYTRCIAALLKANGGETSPPMQIIYCK